MRLQAIVVALVGFLVGVHAFWLEDIPHQGVAPFAGAGYSFFRNVKDYGAKGDGVTDDIDAITRAITEPGNRCEQGCASQTTTPAILYFPPGTYVISRSIVPYYFTQMYGDPTNRPVLKATSGFQGFGLIDGNVYHTENPNWVTTNVFYRQVRNFVIDTTAIPPATAATGMHWPTSQATSLINIEFNMPAGGDVVHVGLFIESGSGGFMSDLTFNGGATGASMGNQQYTMRNFVFNNCGTAIIQLWNWGWTYTGFQINNCGKGIDISAGGSTAQDVGSIILMDSSIVNTPVGIVTAFSSSSQPATSGSIVLENVNLQNVPVAVQGPQGTLLSGSSGSVTITGWSQGHRYLPTGPNRAQGAIDANTRPAALLDGGKYYSRSKPQYENLSVGSFVSVRSAGAKGDAAADDTAAIQSAINEAAAAGKVLFIDYGLYRLTSPITIPPGSKIVGEGYPVLMAAGTSSWSDVNNPQAFIKVGSTSGQEGVVELSDFVVSTQGSQPGAILIEWNLASTGTPSGMWDVHTRIGGFTASQLQVAQCEKVPGSSAVVSQCIAAYMSMHVTKQATGLYMENVWLWVADHDIDDTVDNTQTTIYAGRGIYIESTIGRFWLYGTASEHHVLYNYQFANTKNIYASQLQTETPYFMPTPNALVPFPVNAALKDPDFTASCAGVAGNCAAAWGLRIIDSSDIFVYGAGLYSFFSSYSTTCSTVEAGENCQSRIASLEGNISNLNIYTLNTIGSLSMLDRDGTSLASWQDNVNVFPANIAVFRTG